MKWWKNLLRRRSQEAELDAELRFHLDRQFQELVDAGLSPHEARRRVRLEFGGLARAKDDCRDVRPLYWLEDLVRDVHLGFRGLRRDPLFAASVTIILALGIGASVAMFSVLNAVVLRPLPYARPGELVMLNTHYITQNQWDGTSVPNFLDWREQSKSFAAMTFYRRTQASEVTFAGGDGPQRARGGFVGPGFFELLGASPLIGRTFSQAEFDRADRVVVLSEGLWQEQFAGSHAALGRTLSSGGVDYLVIGVMPRTFQLPTSDTRFWAPLSLLPWWNRARSAEARDGDSVEVIGRLAAGVRFEDARAEMSLIAARLRETHAVNRNRDIRLVPLFDHVIGSRTRSGVWLGFAAVLSLLAIACANVGGLLTARAARRRHELAVRSALGAQRSRLVRQLLAEGVSLWAVASVFGVALAYGAIRMLLAFGPRTLPRMEQAGIDSVSLAAAFLGGLVVVALSGTMPALLAAKTDDRAAFGVRNPSSLRRQGPQDLLVVGQIAGAVVLLVGAVLLAQSFLRAQREDPGYPAENVLVVRIEGGAMPDFFPEAQERIGRLPGVIAVGGVKQFFLRRNADQRVTIEGRPAAIPDDSPRLAVDGVVPGYFRAMGIELLEGRDFDDRDLRQGTTASVVNETMARRFWPGGSAVGKRWIGGGSPPKDGRWSIVVGVVKDMRREGLDVAPIAAAFVPARLSTNLDMTIRTAGDPADLVPAIRREIRSIDPSLPIPVLVSAGKQLSERLGGRRFETQLLAVFAAIALLLSAAGLYASLAYQVALRTREIGIRAALGARRQSIVGMIVGRGIRLAIAGAVLGLLGAASLARVMQGLLYETGALNPAGYAAAAGLVLLVAAIAAWAPAQRAAAVSPMTALRED